MLLEHWTDIQQCPPLVFGTSKHNPSIVDWIVQLSTNEKVTTEQIISWFDVSKSDYLIMAVGQTDGTEVYYRIESGLNNEGSTKSVTEGVPSKTGGVDD